MRIENELKLGFKDVMIRPKRSTLKSRSQVSLERNFNFVNSKKQWRGVPIIAANMDTVGTFEMAIALSKDKIIKSVHNLMCMMHNFKGVLSKCLQLIIFTIIYPALIHRNITFVFPNRF